MALWIPRFDVLCAVRERSVFAYSPQIRHRGRASFGSPTTISSGRVKNFFSQKSINENALHIITQIKYNFVWLWSFLFLLKEKSPRLCKTSAGAYTLPCSWPDLLFFSAWSVACARQRSSAARPAAASPPAQTNTAE
jgi:hypothetical protein